MKDFRFSRATEQTWPKTVLGFWRAAYTVFYVRTTMYARVAAGLRKSPQPMQPSLDQELAAVRSLLRNQGRPRHRKDLTGKELLGLMGTLMQFTEPLPRLRPYFRTPYAHVGKLYDAVTAEGAKNPLSFSRQLDIALRQTGGDLPEAVWRLFVAGRLFARWYDTQAITGLPGFTQAEITDMMTRWARSLKAAKEYGSCPDQDTAGDTYYCWTHALSAIAFDALAARRTPLNRAEAWALRNGTRLNHGILHRISPQVVPSDHTAAAGYGNALGALCADYLNGRLS